ncbi:hypothetical protein H5407_01450 [Mitsuaria sp. WAJ17]|uniref:hypothetical protein n=1 Tax=Mitsuaria sp. WAJ17 TaxID=2761452 RepID=UPI0015FF8C41|nr:hypothetical protein [Mitsuaria sp. WAJ17]MBB2483883.1 hypothetical protein [Mitsuaria sp. WAJ17]
MLSPPAQAEADWPSPLNLVLQDSELLQLQRGGDEGLIELSSALVHWPSLSQRRPQQGWVWPLRLRCSGLESWEVRDFTPGRIVQARLTLDGQDLTPQLPAFHAGRVALQLELARGGSLHLQARTLRIGLEGALLRESLAC